MFLVLLACHPDDPGKPPPDDSAPVHEDTAPDSAPDAPAPPAAFDRWCLGADWKDSAEPLTLPQTSGSYLGYLPDHTGWRKGTVEQSKIVPRHPFHVTAVRVQFADGTGTARVRLMTTFGRSYPGGYPELDTEGVNVLPPVEVEVTATGDADDWTELDVSALGVFLEPTQHYAMVNEYAERGGPTVGVESLPSGESSRALLILPDQDTPYGLDGNFRMELVGERFCAWEDRWFAAHEVPFADEPSALITVADFDGDGHQDVVSYGRGPTAWRGDGDGGFAEDPEAWPEAAHTSWLLFGDVDNDGDEDAFAASYVGADSDGDGVTLAEGDCNDADAAVRPGASETTDRRDEDCDGVADDGTDPGDEAGDGVALSAGDCDDTRSDVAPGLAELKDSVDNDCDLAVDEDFPSRMLLNDGSGRYRALPGAGVEVTEPSTAGGFADADEDGWLDLYVGNWLEHYPDDAAVQDRYWVGLGGGHFADGLAGAGLALENPLSVYGLTWGDYNDDAHADLYVANYHLYNNQLWENQGDGTFLDLASEKGVAHDEEHSPYVQYPGGHSYGGEFADIDNDGDMDLFVANLSHPRTQPWADPSMLAVNQGAPDHAFVNEREERGLLYDEGDVNAQFADFDNDMDLDLAIASLYSQHYARVYRNDGGVFTDVTYEVGVDVEDAGSVIWADVDEDGDEDLLVADRFGAPYVHLFDNRVGQDRHWVDLVPQGTTSNRDGAGARITVVAGGLTQVRDVQLGNGSFNTQRPRLAHFGLGEHLTVDEVRVRWIGGAEESFAGVGADGRWVLVEGSGVASR